MLSPQVIRSVPEKDNVVCTINGFSQSTDCTLYFGLFTTSYRFGFACYNLLPFGVALSHALLATGFPDRGLGLCQTRVFTWCDSFYSHLTYNFYWSEASSNGRRRKAILEFRNTKYECDPTMRDTVSTISPFSVCLLRTYF